MMMDVERTGRKRTRKTTARKGVKAPRRTAQRGAVIPGLLKTRGEEKKVLFTGTPNLAVDATGTIQCLNLIQVGSSMFNRIGRRIEMISVRFTGSFDPIVATRQVESDYLRIAIVYDRQTNGAFPALADIFQDTDQAGTNTTNAKSGLNMNNRERFVVIMDKRIYIPQLTLTAGVWTNPVPSDGGHWQVLMDEYRRLNKLTTHYKADSTPAVIGDISTGALFICSLAENGAGTGACSVEWNVRLKYVDV